MDSTQHYDARFEASRFCYQQMQKHITKLINHVNEHGPRTERAHQLRLTVEYYRKQVNALRAQSGKEL